MSTDRTDVSTAAERLAAHALDAEFSDLSADVRAAVGKYLADWTGLVVGGASLAESSDSISAAVDALAGGRRPTGDGEVASHVGSPGDGLATDLSSGARLAPDRAALANGTYAHSLDFDDTHRASSLHPGAPVVSAALAVGEAEGANGEELATAIVVGYDVACALGRAVNPDAHYGRGFHITATCGTFGATAAAGRLRGLSQNELASAFGVNGSQAAGLLQFLENGAWNKRLHPGLAASRAVVAAELAASGFRGAAAPLEGDNGFFAGYTEDAEPERLVDLEPGRALLRTALKPYPCCRYTHAAIDGLLDLADAVDPADVTAVRVDLPASGVTLTGDPIDAKRRPSNFVDCQFSMPFAAALVLTEGDAGLSAFLDAQDRLDDPELRRLMDATTVTTTDRTRLRFPETWAAGVEVETESGTHERFVEHARGEPECPLSEEAVARKFEELATAADCDPEAATAALEACRELGRSGDAPYDALRALSG
ncbi:MmgE/PrpD family protein [Haloprofundus salilacus]|uniref:MmgE/PrpD family protein n=1 Tax=Haloprofundus salilacus TaxID=2876190 RepID=UPI001CD00A92|nr:MmgE/PrpD family protein [Haloprofundus salilacus]